METIRRRISDFLAVDDVFFRSFLENIIITAQSENPSMSFSESNLESLAQWGTTSIVQIEDPTSVMPPNGPYIFDKNSLRQDHRCHPDPYDAFVAAVIPSATDTRPFPPLFHPSLSAETAIRPARRTQRRHRPKGHEDEQLLPRLRSAVPAGGRNGAVSAGAARPGGCRDRQDQYRPIRIRGAPG